MCLPTALQELRNATMPLNSLVSFKTTLPVTCTCKFLPRTGWNFHLYSSSSSTSSTSYWLVSGFPCSRSISITRRMPEEVTCEILARQPRCEETERKLSTKEEGTGMTQRCLATGSGHPVYFLFILVSVTSKHRLDHDACRIAFAFPPSSTNSIVATRAAEKQVPRPCSRHIGVEPAFSVTKNGTDSEDALRSSQQWAALLSYAMCTSPKPTHIFRISGRKWITEAVGTVHVERRGLGKSDLTTPSCWNGIKTSPYCTSFETRMPSLTVYFFIDILVDCASSTRFLHFDLQLLVWHSYEVPFLYRFLEWRRVRKVSNDNRNIWLD